MTGSYIFPQNCFPKSLKLLWQEKCFKDKCNLKKSETVESEGFVSKSFLAENLVIIESEKFRKKIGYI
jgi:hypothetical protein